MLLSRKCHLLQYSNLIVKEFCYINSPLHGRLIKIAYHSLVAFEAKYKNIPDRQTNLVIETFSRKKIKNQFENLSLGQRKINNYLYLV